MNPELSVILFTVDIGFLVILLAGAVWSVAFPAKRAWPPPQRRSWQYVLTWASYDAVCGLSTALLFLDWNSWAFASPLRFIVGVPLALLGGMLAVWGMATAGWKNTSGQRGGFVSSHYCPTFSAPQQHLRVWGTRWRGRREQLHQWTAVEQVELENS